MTSSTIRIRRATVDDLNSLRAIWSSMQLAGDDLEKRLKEFQVAEVGGKIIGAMGIQFSNQYALLYAEGFSDFSFADAARELFGERIQTLAANHGVFRIWTRENSPFWLRWGFQPASDELLRRLPEQWKMDDGKWLTLQLKDENAVAAALENKFAGFMDAEKQQTAQISEKAKTLKIIITIFGFAVFFLCMGVLIYWFTHGRLDLH